MHVLGRASRSAGEHSLWTAQEDESDFTLPVRLVKHVPIGNAEQVVEVSIALRVSVHALLLVVRKCVAEPASILTAVPYTYYLQRVWLDPNFKLRVFLGTYRAS